MKNNIIYYALPVAALLLFVPTGCSNDNETPQDSSMDSRQITISAAQGTLKETRLGYDYQVGGTMDIAWSANDAFYVIDTHSSNATDGKTFTIQGDGGGNTANFSGTQPTGATFNAFYPAAKATGKTWSKCEFDVSGQEQNGNASTAHLSDYNFMTLTQEITSTDLEESTLSFQHGIAIFRIEVTLPTGKTPGELQLKTRKSDPYNATNPYGFVINKGMDGTLRRVSHTTSMTLTDINSNQFTAYMAVLPTTLKEGLSIEIYCTDHSAYKKDIAFETWSFTAGKIYHAKVKNADLVDISHTVYHTDLIASMNLDNNQIKSAADLKYIMETPPSTFDGETFKLTTDIHVTASEWKALYVNGIYTRAVAHNLSGDNHIVSGRLINRRYNYFGFIGSSYQSEITGLHITADIVNGANTAENIGGVIGLSTGSTISNCSFSGSIGGNSAWFVGGICGSIEDYDSGSSILTNNSSNTCTFKGVTIGGLIGAIWNSTPTINVCNSLCTPLIGVNP